MVLCDDFYGKVVLEDVDVGMVAYGTHQPSLYLCSCVVCMVEYAEL